jgi:hypothetical protein
MNLAEKYKQLFEGKVRSNDAVLLGEAGPVFEPGPGETLQGDTQALLDINDSNFENVSKESEFMKSILKNYDNTYKRLYEYTQALYGSKGIKQHLDKIRMMGDVKKVSGKNEFSSETSAFELGEDGPEGMRDNMKDMFAKELSGEHGEDMNKVLNVYAARLFGAYILNQQCELKEKLLKEIDEAVGEGETDAESKINKRKATVTQLLKDIETGDPEIIRSTIKEDADKFYDQSTKDKYIEEVQKAIDGGGLVSEYDNEVGSIEKVVDSGKLEKEGVGLFDDVKSWIGDKFKKLKKNWDDLVGSAQTADTIS